MSCVRHVNQTVVERAYVLLIKCGKGRTVRMPCLWNDIRLPTSALSSAYLIAFCRQKLFNNVTTEEKLFICQKNICFAADFSPDFVSREALTRCLRTSKARADSTDKLLCLNAPLQINNKSPWHFTN